MVGPLSPLLRPFGTRLWTPGQVKPRGIPEINWKHPLTLGLTAYWFNIGYTAIELITARTMGALTTWPPVNVPSPYGTSVGFNTNSTALVDPNNWPQQAWTAPYSYACGWYQYGSAANATDGWFGLADASGNDAFMFFGSGTLNFQSSMGNAASPYNVVLVSNRFNVAVSSATGATAQSHWFNGVAQTAGTVTSAFTGTNMRMLLGSTQNVANASNPNAGIFFGAVWLRVLSQADAIQLYTDPYCFLVPPEPEMMIIQSAAVAAVSEEVHWSIYRPRVSRWGH